MVFYNLVSHMATLYNTFENINLYFHMVLLMYSRPPSQKNFLRVTQPKPTVMKSLVHRQMMKVKKELNTVKYNLVQKRQRMKQKKKKKKRQKNPQQVKGEYLIIPGSWAHSSDNCRRDSLSSRSLFIYQLICS